MSEQKQSKSSRKFVTIFLFLFPNLVFADDHKHSSPWIGAVIVAASLTFLLIPAAAAVLVRRYCNSVVGAAAEDHHVVEAAPPQGGLESAEVESLPSVRFSEIKIRRLKQDEDTCAVCLNEFEDSDILRVLPDCCHVFHPDCIAPWLASHVTYPVCRASLEHRQESGVSVSSVLERVWSGISLSETSDHQSHQHNDDHHTVEIV